MKRTRTVGLAVVMSLALAACFGTASASAAGFVINNDFFGGNLTGEATDTHWIGWGSQQKACSDADFTAGTGWAGDPVEADFGGDVACGSTVLKQNDCKFIFRPGPDGTGPLEIGPPGCGAMSLEPTEGTNCTRLFHPTTDLSAIYSNVGNDVVITVNATGINTSAPKPCGDGVVYTFGKYSGSWTLRADRFGTPMAIAVKEKVPVPLGLGFEADKYPVHIGGTSAAPNGPEWKMAGYTAKCTDVEYGSNWEMSGTTSEIRTGASYSGCKFGTLPTTVLTDGCEYVFTFEGGTAGSQDIACPGANKIRMLIHASKTAQEEGKVICEAEIGSQGVGPVDFGESGWGYVVGESSLTSLDYTFIRKSAVCPKFEGAQTDGTYTEKAKLHAYID